MPDDLTLQASRSTTLATVSGVVTGRVELGPDQGQGPPRWHVDGVILQTSRPGAGPVPRAQVYRNDATADNSLGLSYDGSFAQGRCAIDLSRGEKIVIVWIGGQVGDVATATLTGTKRR